MRVGIFRRGRGSEPGPPWQGPDMSDGKPREVNQTPEEVARDRIDDRLRTAGWQVQDRDTLDLDAGPGVAVREYPTDIGPADYVLFAGRRAVGVIEAKPDSWGVRLTTVEEQSSGYARARLKWVSDTAPLPFLYESTGEITRFTNGLDPEPRSRARSSPRPRRPATTCSPTRPSARRAR